MRLDWLWTDLSALHRSFCYRSSTYTVFARSTAIAVAALFFMGAMTFLVMLLIVDPAVFVGSMLLVAAVALLMWLQNAARKRRQVAFYLRKDEDGGEGADVYADLPTDPRTRSGGAERSREESLAG